MCGLVGMANLTAWSSPGRQSWFEHALLVDQLRGDHSTGVAVVPKFDFKGAPEPLLFKSAVSASDFLYLKKARKILNHADDAAVVLGHNRYATQGKIDDSSAHPFLTDHVALMHNGTLDTRKGLDHDHVIDSASIALQMHHTDPTKYTSVLSQLEGAFALVWFNVKNNTLYMTRNDERPLWVAWGTQHKSMFFASEKWMISELMERKNLVLLVDDPIEIETGVLYSTSYDPKVTTDLKLTEEKYTPQPTWCGSWKQADNWVLDYYDNYDPKTRTQQYKPASKVIDLIPPSTCPVAKGEEIYIDNWDWKVYKSRSDMGSIIGVDPDHRGVAVVVPNVSATDWKEFVDLWNFNVSECPDDEMPWIFGRVTAIDSIKKKKEWVATIDYKSVFVDCIPFAMTDEEKEDAEKK